MSDSSRSPELTDFPVITTLAVQWGDMDALQHVNNVTFFRWFESARIEYLDEVGIAGLLPSATHGPILAATECNYRRQLVYPDTVQIGTRTTRIGRSSITLEHAVFSQKDSVLIADGSSTMVLFDYERQKSITVPDDVRTRISELEQEDFGHS